MTSPIASFAEAQARAAKALARPAPVTKSGDDVPVPVGSVGSADGAPQLIIEAPEANIPSSEQAAVGSVGSVGSVSQIGGVLSDVRSWFGRFVCVMDELDLDLLTLWAFHTHLAFETYSTPRLVLDSSMPGSGKTTVLEHLSRLCLKPVQAASLSSPALLTRMLHQELRTILIDEVDRSLDPKKPGVEDLIAVLNSGYKRGATRPVLTPAKGGDWEVTEMSTFGPVAMAGNSPALPDDTRSRCIRVLLMPDLDGIVESSDWEEIEEEAVELGHRLAVAAEAVRDAVRTCRPPISPDCVARSKERWYPIKRVATVAGKRWADVADELIRRDLAEAQADREDGLANVPPAVRLLRDIHTVWPDDRTFVSSTELVLNLVAVNPQSWSSESNYGKDLTVQRLGRMLVQGFKIHSTRQGDSKRGYFRDSFNVAFRRLGITSHDRTDGSDGTDGTDGNLPDLRASRTRSIHTSPRQIDGTDGTERPLGLWRVSGEPLIA